MKTILIVDDKSHEIAEALNAAANADGHEIHYRDVPSPEVLFAELARSQPDLVLLHHHWPGYSIASILRRLTDTNPRVRVVVFTGQNIDIAELIECVRYGVCDYWLKQGTLDFVVASRKLATYCAHPALTLELLGRPSGPVLDLLTAAEVNLTRLLEVEDQLSKTAQELESVKSEESRQLWKTLPRAVEFVVLAAVLVSVVLLLDTHISDGAILGTLALLVLLFLFLHDKISGAILRFGKRVAELRK